MAYVGSTLQVGVSKLGGAYKGQASIGASVGVVPNGGFQVRAPYQPGQLQLLRLTGGAAVGVSLRAGISQLASNALTSAVTNVSGIKLTDGYQVASDSGVLSIDPLTGSASISERIHPQPGMTVQDIAAQHDMQPSDLWELHYQGTIVAQGTVISVSTDVSIDAPYWVKQTEYTLGGWASRMLAASVSWTSLPAEGALTRLKRFFPNVDLTQLTSAQAAYLDTVTADADANPDTSTLLDQARAFSALTFFPVRTANNMPDGSSSGLNLVIVPAVTFKGADPQPLYLPPTKTWTNDAQFLADQVPSLPGVQTVQVIKNYDAFISGVGKQALTGGQLGLSFTLGTTRVGGGTFSIDVGVRAPAVVSVFGATRVISQINHEFTSEDYRSSLTLTVPAVIT